jgi:hypothetical protein
VGGAEDGRLGAHSLDAAQQELSETACLFDPPEHRLGQLLAQPAGVGVPAGLDLPASCGEDVKAVASPLARPLTTPATTSLARPVAR